jgi:radical SAM superfamily enzyme YgiQ (UPF0313 family)
MKTIAVTPERGAPVRAPRTHPSILLVGPYDPKGGEYTFLAPPLGVWRLAGVLRGAGVTADVFDPNCCDQRPEEALEEVLRSRSWDIVGISTTGMTLPYDLALAHLVRRVRPGAWIVAGGMEATFKPDSVLSLGPFNAVVLGEGEEPLVEMVQRLRLGYALDDVPGTAFFNAHGTVTKLPQSALSREKLRDAIFATPYEEMPYERYWARLERAYGIGRLPVKAEREARLAEIRSVRLITLNYCPMGCTFCSSTNFLHAAQGGQTARIARLDEHECIAMLKRIVGAHPQVQTVIFQDDIFVFTQDKRILPLCEAIVAAKASGELPDSLQFISTNRIDAMNPERLAAMRRAGFRVLGFGVESFAPAALKEFNKAQIVPHITPMLQTALDLGITPFLDLILTSPRGEVGDLALNIRSALGWIDAGCEVGMYPYVIPFSGAPLAADPTLIPHTIMERRLVAGTNIAWDQPSKILPVAPDLRRAILTIERHVDHWLERLSDTGGHLPSRVRSLIWIACAIPVLASAGHLMPGIDAAEKALKRHLPVHRHQAVRGLFQAQAAMARRAS